MRIAIAMMALVAAPAYARGSSEAVRITEEAAGGTVRLHPGQELIVAVEACIGCAYRWSVTQLPPVLTATGTTEVDQNPPSTSDEPILGGGKTVEYHFRSTRAGRGRLVLRNVSITRDRRVARTVQLSVIVL